MNAVPPFFLEVVNRAFFFAAESGDVTGGLGCMEFISEMPQ
jgi:hypothetical protein